MLIIVGRALIAKVDVLANTDAGHVGVGVPIIGQGAVDLAALAAGALGTVGNEQEVGGSDGIHQTCLRLRAGASHQGEQGAGEGDAGKTFTRQFHELAAGILAIHQRLLGVRHNLFLLACRAYG